MFTASQAVRNISCWDNPAQLWRVQTFFIPFKLWEIFSNSFLERTVELSKSILLSTISPNQLWYLKDTSLLLGFPCLSRSSAPCPLPSPSTFPAFQLGGFSKDFTVDLCLESCSYKTSAEPDSRWVQEPEAEKSHLLDANFSLWSEVFFNFLHKHMKAKELPAVKGWSGFRLQSFTATCH